jgi:hypothetical protein
MAEQQNRAGRSEITWNHMGLATAINGQSTVKNEAEVKR